MKFKNLWKTLACASIAVFAAVGCEEDVPEPVKLETPVPAVKSTETTAFTVAWAAVKNAETYVYQLNDSEEVSTTNSEVSFTGLEAGTYSFKVKATSSNKNYLDSEWGSTSITLEAEAPTPVFSVQMVEFDQTSFKALVTTQHVLSFAWVLSDGTTTYTEPTEIFEAGTVVECEDGDTPVEMGGLNFNTPYVVYFAACIGENQYVAEIPTLEFTTLDSDEDVAVYDVDYREFKVRVRVPDTAEEAGNVIRWGFIDYATYNMRKESFFGYTTDAEMIINNDGVYHNFFTTDTTFVVNEENSIVYDANGNPIDDMAGGYITYYDPIVPGQPEVLIFGEYAYTEEDYTGWGPGYYAYLFDLEGFLEDYYNGGVQPRQAAVYDEAEYWTGFYNHTEIMLKEPTLLEANLNFDASGMTPKGGSVTFNPDPEVYMYCVLVADSYTLNGVLGYLNNDEDLLQWYTTSFNAAYNFGAMSLAGPVELDLGEFFWEMYPDETYYILAVGLGDENGTSQCFEMHALTLPEPTEPAPVVVVTPIENPNGEDPYHVWFNVKSPTKDCEAAYYMADYVRAWENELQWDGYNNLMASYGNPFSAEEVEMINSDAGLDVSFTSLPNYTTRLAVAGENWEGTREDLDAEGCQAIAENTTPRVTPKERVESPLFADLLGEWTATATVKYSEYDYDIWDYVYHEVEMTSKVVIGNPAYPETLSEDVYALYEAGGISREETDALYEDFKRESAIFEEDVRNQNRMVCLGFDFAASWEGQLPSASPYELFTMADYSAYNNAALFYDFGQKWYLEVDAAGNVTAPINQDALYPMSNWNYYYPLYLAGLGAEWESEVLGPVSEGDAWPAFPVEVSADGNTITLKPMDYYGITTYPNVVYDYYGLSLMQYQVVSEVVLTRGWNGEEAAAAAPNRQQIQQTRNAQKVIAPNRPYARTIFTGKKPVEYQKVTYNFVTREQFEKNIESLVK